MKKHISIIFAILFSTFIFGQVGINTDKPSTSTGLHISERKDPSSTAVPDRYNGVLIQRYTTGERDGNLTSTLGASQNGLTIFNKSTACYNVWNWNTSSSSGSWASLCGEKQGLADFSDCSSIKVVGKYITDKSLAGQTVHIDVPVKVTALGTYSYTTNTVNGVTFTAQGNFVNLGPQTVSLYASSATSPVVGTFNYTVTIAPTASAGSAGVSCSNVPVVFVSRATSALKIVNVAGTNGTSLVSGTTAASRLYNWMTGSGTAYTSNAFPAAANTALSYSGTASIQVVNVTLNSIAALSDALSDASIVYVGANQGISNGFANVIKEWNDSTGGFVINYADKVEESGLADVLEFYVEDGAAANGTLVGTANLPAIFAGSPPYASLADGLVLGYSGSNAGQISTSKGSTFINVGVRKAGVIDLTRNIVIFGDKFGDDTGANSQNFAKVLFDIMAYALKNAPLN